MKISKNSLIGIITIIFLAIFTFYPSFKLALFGDDWLAFFRYVQHLGPSSSGEWNHFTYYSTPYGPQDMIMGILYKIYGYNSVLYYYTSLFLRLLAAFSLFPLVYYLTKNKLSAFFASLFFAVTAIGLDTTNWVFNMPTYVTISLFFLSLYFFISAREEKFYKKLIISAILYYISYVTTPIRMHGSLIFLFFLEAFWVLQNRNIPTIKKAAQRFGLIFLVFLIVKFGGDSLGPPEEIGERLNLGITATTTMLGQGRFDFLFHPLVMIGGMLLPDLLLRGTMVNSIGQTVSAILPAVVIATIFVFLVFKTAGIFNDKKFLKLMLLFAIWDLVVIIVTKGNITSFGNSVLVNLLLIGGYVVITSLYLLNLFIKQKNLANIIFLSLSWMFFSFVFAWWWVPASLFPTTYRYLIVSAAGTAILLSTIISLGKSKSMQIRLFLLLMPFILINIYGTRLYLNYVSASHNQEISEKIWSSIPYVPELIKSPEPLIFYFEAEEGNGNILHDVITFGFPPHMALIYNLKAGDPIPVPMSDFKELTSAVIDGKPMPAYGYKVKPVEIDRIYAFHLQGNNNLINITDNVREKLRGILKESQATQN